MGFGVLQGPVGGAAKARECRWGAGSPVSGFGRMESRGEGKSRQKVMGLAVVGSMIVFEVTGCQSAILFGIFFGIEYRVIPNYVKKKK